MSKEAMKLALEAVEELHRTGDTQVFDMYYAQPVIKALEEALAKQEQGEPVGVAHLMQEGFTHCIWSEACVPVGTKFYTTPQQRTWVGLTEEDLKLLSADWRIVYGAWMDDFARDIEAKLKEKNT